MSTDRVNETTIQTSAAPPHGCPYCGLPHAGTCPRVKAIEYHPDGSLKRVEFHQPPPVQITSLRDLVIGEPYVHK